MVAWRKSRGLNQRDAAKLAGIKQPTWHGYENGKVPSARKLSRIIDVTEGAVTAADYYETAEESAIRAARRAQRTVRPEDSSTSLDDDVAKAG